MRNLRRMAGSASRSRAMTTASTQRATCQARNQLTAPRQVSTPLGSLDDSHRLNGVNSRSHTAADEFGNDDATPSPMSAHATISKNAAIGTHGPDHQRPRAMPS